MNKKLKNIIKDCLNDDLEFIRDISGEVGYANYQNYVLNANVPIGIAVVMFTPWHDLRNKARIAMDFEEKARKAKSSVLRRKFTQMMVANLEDAKKAIDMLAGNDGTSNVLYVSPLGEQPEVDEASGLLSRPVFRRAMEEVYKRAATMAITPSNVYSFCVDMIDSARFVTENIIDSTKTLLPVRIPCQENMARIKLWSRENKQSLSCNWAEKSVEYTTGADETCFKPKTVWVDGKRKIVNELYINDLANHCRNGIFAKVVELGQELVGKEQQLPDELKDAAEAVAAAYRPLAEVFKELRDRGRDLSAAKSRSLEKFKGQFVDEETGREDKSHRAKQSIQDFEDGLALDYNKAFPAISSMLREAAKLEGLSDEEIGALALWTAYQKTKKGENTEQLSQFATTSLQEEFVKFVLSVFKDIDTNLRIPLHAEDVGEDIKSGERLLFQMGCYFDPKNEDRFVETDETFDGLFKIKKGDDEQWFLMKDFTTLIDTPEPADELLIVTKVDPKTMKEVRPIIEQIVGKEVTLLPKTKVGGVMYYDSIMVDGNIIGKFKGSVGKYSDVGSTKKLNDAANEILRALYQKRGVVDWFDFKGASTRSGEGVQAIIHMKDVRPYDPSEIEVKENLIGKIEERIEAERAKKKAERKARRAAGKAACEAKRSGSSDAKRELLPGIDDDAIKRNQKPAKKTAAPKKSAAKGGKATKKVTEAKGGRKGRARAKGSSNDSILL